ncbi:MAG: hypothetical protein ACE5E5_14370 [Phycisphaerae bacterium]
MKAARHGVKLAICAWCDANALDVADGEIADLVRRLQSLDAMTGCDADGIERVTTDMIHFAADRIDGEPEKAERLRALAAHISKTLVAVGLTVDARCAMPDGERDSSGGVAGPEGADDIEPGDAVGDAQPLLRYEAVYLRPVFVTLRGKRAKATWPPSFGMVRLKPEGSRRSVTVALDELDDRNRRILRNAKVRLRTEVVVRCRVAHCTRCYLRAAPLVYD